MQRVNSTVQLKVHYLSGDNSVSSIVIRKLTTSIISYNSHVCRNRIYVIQIGEGERKGKMGKKKTCLFHKNQKTTRTH